MSGSESRGARNYECVGPKLFLFALLALTFAVSLLAQTNVTTQHNDIARTGQNTNETVLTPANVSAANSFGKLFYYVVDGYVYAQPLYLANVVFGSTSAQPKTHNVIFVATEHDGVYAFDADSNLGPNAQPLWQISLLDAAHGAAQNATTVPSADLSTTDIVPEIGITSTPVIDPVTGTLYVVGKSKENGTYVQRLHALDVTSGKEKFGGPVTITASVPGNGTGSSNGILTFDPKWQLQRAGLLLLNGVVYIGFGAHQDFGVWHGWILGYNAPQPNTSRSQVLTQTGVWCSSPNGVDGGTWMSGAGLAADVPDPSGHPYGRMFTATGNGSYSAIAPNYDNTMNFGDSVLKLDLANGAPTMIANGTTVGDLFTPFDQANLNNKDLDVASGGVLLLPDSVSGTQHLLTQVGKTGRIYVLNRNNLGGYNPNNTTDPQQKAGVGGTWSMPAYWNGFLYFWAVSDSLKQYTFGSGAISTSPVSTSAETSGFPGSTPAVSSNGTSNGIVWNIRSDAAEQQGRAILYAHDATKVANTLYSSEQNVPRDNPGNAVKFVVPTVANGKVYVGAEHQLSVYGLLNGLTQASVPVISPGTELFHGSLQVNITTSSSNGQIFYTTDGSMPGTASNFYTGPFTISATETIRAIAGGTGYLASVPSNATYTEINQVPTPTFNLPPGDYSSGQSVAITSAWSAATIYYTMDGSTPTTASTQYSGPVPINSTTTLKAIGVAPNLTNSAIVSGLYTIVQNSPSSIDFAGGFTMGSMALVGRALLNGTQLQLTDGGAFEASAAWYPAKVNIQGFSTDFTFQQTPGTSPVGDGMTLTIQGNGTASAGSSGGSLGYGPNSSGSTPGIPKSAAVKFDLYNNAGEGNNSIGLYTNGAMPTVPATTLGSGVNLQSGDIFAVHITYDGTTLTMTITDQVTNATFTASWLVNIPSLVGGNTAYVGFTAGTGRDTAVQDILEWTFASSATGSQPAVAAPVISPVTGTYNSPQTVTISDSTSNATIYYTLDAGQPTTSSTQYKASFPVNATTTVKAIALAPGFSMSSTSTSVITIQTGSSPAINFSSGFTATGLQFNGHTKLNGTRLQLTDTATTFEVASAYWNIPVNVQTFTNDFTFQLTTPNADGFAFVIQNAGLTASGPAGGGLGYGPSSTTGTPGIPQSVALKFDLYNNAGEGANSTGLYTYGASPTVPATTLGGGVNLHSGDTFQVHTAYDGTTLTMTITDLVNTANTFTTSWPINIPSTVGGNTAYVGFTAGTGGATAIQEILNWTYSTSGSPSTPAATPMISPATATYSSAQTVTITDATSGATIYYTIDGSQPTTSSPKYSGPFSVSTTTTVNAIATAPNFAQSATASSTITISQPAGATPVITPASGTYSSAQTVTITDTTSSATIYYTIDGSQPTTSSTPYTASFTVSTTTTVKAIATAPSFTTSATATSVITIQSSAPTINYASGFSATGLQLNGYTKIAGATLELTNGGGHQAGSAWYATPVNVQGFTTDFTVQLTNANADGFTFAIENAGVSALGDAGGGLGYASGTCGSTTGIASSVAVKFDLYQNCQEGNNSTGLYTNGASPTSPSTTLGVGGGVNLHSGDTFHVHITYDGTTLTMTITDTVNTANTFTTSWPINIPATVGGNTAFVGFTGGTGGFTAIQQILTWTYGP